MVYNWKEAFHPKANPQLVGEELESLGSIKPEQLVEYARSNQNSELHKCFEWDDTKAAHRFRIEQARLVFQMLTVTNNDSTGKAIVMRAYEHVEENNEGVYMLTKKALTTSVYREQVFSRLKNGIEELQTIGNTYSRFIGSKRSFNAGLETAKKALDKPKPKKRITAVAMSG